MSQAAIEHGAKQSPTIAWYLETYKNNRFMIQILILATKIADKVAAPPAKKRA